MLATPSFVVSNNGNITVLYERKAHQIASDHPNYTKIRDALKHKNFKNFDKLLDTGAALAKMSKGVCKVEFGEVYFNNKPLHNVVTERILSLMREDFPFEPMLRFLENLMMNLSERAIKELYSFLAHRGLPITEDGCFLAYKSVTVYTGSDSFTDVNGHVVKNGDYVDKWTRRVRNNPGDVVEMPREDVDDNPNNTCSRGYHCGALDYAGPGGWYNRTGDKVIIVKVNPKDVVSVPADHNAQKLRVCKYEVLYDYADVLEAPVYSSAGNEYEYDGSKDYSDDEWDCGDAEGEVPIDLEALDDDYKGDDMLKAFDYDTAYDAGKAARNRGVTIIYNPFDLEEEDAFYGWQDGWEDADLELAVSLAKRSLPKRDKLGRFSK